MATYRDVTVPLTERDFGTLALLRDTPAIARAVGVEPRGTDAVLVHALLRHQLAYVRAQIEQNGYQQFATDHEWREHRAAVRSRQRGGTD